MSTTSTAADLATARADLAALQAEQTNLPEHVTHAVEAANAAALLGARRRGDDLPSHIEAAQIRIVRLEIEALEAELPVSRAAALKLALAADEAWRNVRELTLAAEHASGLAGNTANAAADLVLRIGEKQRALAALVNSAGQDKGPVVRSTWQTGG